MSTRLLRMTDEDLESALTQLLARDGFAGHSGMTYDRALEALRDLRDRYEETGKYAPDAEERR